MAKEGIYKASNPDQRRHDSQSAMKSLSSGSDESLRISRPKRQFENPANLYDGPFDSHADSRRESHISQGFIMYGNRINFAKATHHRILVTGGAGFIGSHLVKRLLEMGNSVIVLDNLVTGFVSNLEELRGNPRLVIIHHDVLDPIPKRLIVDEVYHLACPGSPFFWQTNLINTFTIIVEGTRNVLDFAQRTGAKVLHASTTEIYGDPESGVEVQDETYKGSVECFTERASHDEAKRGAEALCYAYQVERKVKVRIARIGSTYGPKMSVCDGSMVSSFLSALLEGVEIHISETSDATRTLLYVDDCVEGLIKLMNSNYVSPLNIAGDDPITVRDLQLQLKALVANPSNALPWKSVEFFPDEGTRRPANVAAFIHLGWCPEVKAAEGLKSTVLWFKDDKNKRMATREREDEDRRAKYREMINLGLEPYTPLTRLFTLGKSGRSRHK